MSKYIDLELALNELLRVREALSDIPTLEVSEDCISKHNIWKIIEDNAYWVRYNENSTEKGMTLTGINQALNECQPVIPTVSEDCISREYMLKLQRELHGWMPNDKNYELWQKIKDAQSVVPKRAEGEWIISSKWDYKCSACSLITSTYKANFCPNCGAKMKG